MTSTLPPTPYLRGNRPAARRWGNLLVAVGLLALLAQAILSGARAWRERVPQYQVDELADQTLVTPVDLTVIDPEATALAREREGRRLPPLYRFDARIGDLATERFQDDYTRRHALFLQGVRRQWPVALADDELASDRFTDYVAAFRLAHPEFPLADELAQDWAAETDPHQLRNQTATAIREALRQYVVEDELPEAATGYAEVFISAPVAAGGLTNTAELESRASRMQRRVMLPLDKVRARLRHELAVGGSEWAAFAAQFAAANVTYDPAFTSAARAEFARHINVRVDFHTGDHVLKTADPITLVQSAALESLRSHFAQAAQQRGWTEWWLTLFGFGLIAGGVAAPRLARWAGRAADRSALVLSEPTLQDPAEIAALRQGLIHQLGGWLKQQFVQRLIQQRNEAVSAQVEASGQVNLLNERLTRLNPEIRERVVAYERRIAQLERELGGANEVSRELIKTRISMARKELEIEKAKSNLVWN